MINGRMFDEPTVSGSARCVCLLLIAFVGWNTVQAAGAQSPAPVATFKIYADGAIKEPGDHKFVWKVAPDKSLIILIAQRNGRWTIKRLTEWQTQTPKEQSGTFSDALPKHERNSFVWFDDPVIDPEGKYVLICRHTDLKTVPLMGNPDGSALVAVLELNTLNLVYRAQAPGLRGHFLFTPQGTLLCTSWTGGRRFPPQSHRFDHA